MRLLNVDILLQNTESNTLPLDKGCGVNYAYCS